MISALLLGPLLLSFWSAGLLDDDHAGPAPATPPSAPVAHRLLAAGCEATLPLDSGQAFAGPRFLLQGDRVRLFTADPPGPGIAPESRWHLDDTVRLPATPPASGLDRARVKWRDGALWMKAGTRLYQRDPATGQWLLMADPGLEFRDFDLDLRGRTLLIGTADPRTRRYRALVERVLPDRHGTEILFEYPDPGYARWFDRIAPEAAATLLTGYESIQIQEYLLLFNPLARRAFIYQGIDGTLKEADLGLPARGVEELAKLLPAPRAASAAAPADRTRTWADHTQTWADHTQTWADLCWQVLPRSPSEAWLVCAAETFADGERGTQAEPWPRAIRLDLVEGRAGPPVPLPGLKLPVFFDPQGRLTGLGEAMDRFEQAHARPAH